MDQESAAVALGVAAALAVVGLAALPYAVVSRSAIGVYFSGGVGGPPLVALFALVTVIVFLAGYARRSDPRLVAGIAVALGAFMALLSVSWAAAVPADLVGGLTTRAWFAYHRWAFALASVAVVLAAGWYARSVLRP